MLLSIPKLFPFSFLKPFALHFGHQHPFSRLSGAAEALNSAIGPRRYGDGDDSRDGSNVAFDNIPHGRPFGERSRFYHHAV